MYGFSLLLAQVFMSATTYTVTQFHHWNNDDCGSAGASGYWAVTGPRFQPNKAIR